MSNAIEVKNLKKNYGPVEAVKDISFYVEKGTLFAFLGPNGAGKSTTINIICTLLQQNSGEVIVDGFVVGRDDAMIRKQIGIVFQDSLLDPLLTIRENLEARGSFYHMEKSDLKAAIDRALETTDIKGIADRRYGRLSGGQRRRADIARALVHEPQILFLDEPTTGLDPQTRQNVWETIQNLQRTKGMTVFLTTHYMEEANEADYVVIIDDGSIVAQGTPTELKEKYSHDVLKLKPIDRDKMVKDLEGLAAYTVQNDLFVIPLKESVDAIDYLERLKGNIASLQVQNGSMDDAFIEITGKEIRE